ncbi:neighbor of Brca1 gene 1, isoform CRA_b [Rattus norvegicus]|uniref:Neighbor of Brca1 gene 1, isoform CRA_b n=1 Tax=Rattus norvegicus TaxID=10116 RepID=A6HJD5_RAT|nr:neighbor of Brca1 gene 1, isoform CRA_b [Rattus norvegicus]
MRHHEWIHQLPSKKFSQSPITSEESPEAQQDSQTADRRAVTTQGTTMGAALLEDW